MDAGDDQELVLQKTTGDLVSELNSSLTNVLFPRNATGQVVAGTHVRGTTTTRICNLLEPFQEWPQLLDPSLAELLRPLQDALLDSARRIAQHGLTQDSADAALLTIDHAVCKILCTFCKVRGPKVISRFLDNAAENLETAAIVLEAMLLHKSAVSWEEKYIYLLWLGHLVLSPFDLQTVASPEVTASVDLPELLRLPGHVPGIALRLVSLSLSHMFSASKEREPAVKLLSRLAARPDMLGLRISKYLFEYLLNLLKDSRQSCAHSSPYDLIGCLSLTFGLLSSLPAGEISPYLVSLFQELIKVADSERKARSLTWTTAVSRKLVVKNVRMLTVVALKLSDSQVESGREDVAESVVEDAIDLLLTSLADTDTPVRQSASKAISVVTSSLPSQLAAEVCEAIIDSLNENVLWLDEDNFQLVTSKKELSERNDRRRTQQDLSAVDPLRWHGLMLSLAQLLFQRSVPSNRLPSVLSCLTMALKFHQQTTSGSLLGGNVRDAANFGFWSVARRYSTEELSRVKIGEVKAIFNDYDARLTSIIPALAIELICAATLDPSGNIRRGSSAALQELIGRHPDVVFEGIAVVQIVDYHAIALRSRALCDVAIRVSKLHELYWKSIMLRMMGWQGLDAVDAVSRRLAAKAISSMSECSHGSAGQLPMQVILRKLESGRIRSVEQRHGVLLAAAALLCSLSHEMENKIQRFVNLLRPGVLLDEDDLVSNTRRPELSSEAISKFTAGLCIAINKFSNPSILKPSHRSQCEAWLNATLERREQVVILAASEAAGKLLSLLSTPEKDAIISRWIKTVDALLFASGSGCQGYLAALGAVFNGLEGANESLLRQKILDLFMRVLQTKTLDAVHVRVATLTALNGGVFKFAIPVDSIVSNCLISSLQDYTINERGDVGSLVRLEALALARNVCANCVFNDSDAKTRILTLVATLAGERLDKVRFRAWSCLRDLWATFNLARRPLVEFEVMSQTASQEYFKQLLDLSSYDWLRGPVVKGICSSAGSGSESVLRAARSALTNHILDCSNHEKLVFAKALLDQLRETLGGAQDGSLEKTMDHALVPLLEVWGYLFQTNLMSGSALEAGFSFADLLRLIKKAHYKSRSVQKLTAAISVYKGLQYVKEVQVEAIDALLRLLLHPLPRVRNAAADALYIEGPSEELLQTNWSSRPSELKEVVSNVQKELKASY